MKAKLNTRTVRMTRTISLGTTLLAALAASATARGEVAVATPAWQAPGYIMEEVVVTAPAPSLRLAPAVPSDASLPAWQTAGYIMEEVVVTAKRPIDSTLPAWQAPGYVMEEVVVTAARSATTARMLELLALHERESARLSSPDGSEPSIDAVIDRRAALFSVGPVAR